MSDEPISAEDLWKVSVQLPRALMAADVATGVLSQVGPFLADVDDPVAASLARACVSAEELCLRVHDGEPLTA